MILKYKKKSKNNHLLKDVSSFIKDKTQNQINVIYPYRTKHGGWSFDDEAVGLYGEPFVSGIPEIIDAIVGKKTKQFTAFISKDPIPNYTGCLEQTIEKGTGWYKLQETGSLGWLCPATLKYFEDYPNKIYFKIEK